MRLFLQYKLDGRGKSKFLSKLIPELVMFCSVVTAMLSPTNTDILEPIEFNVVAKSVSNAESMISCEKTFELSPVTDTVPLSFLDASKAPALTLLALK